MAATCLDSGPAAGIGRTPLAALVEDLVEVLVEVPMETPMEVLAELPAKTEEVAQAEVEAEPRLLPREPVDSRGQARAPAPAPGLEAVNPYSSTKVQVRRCLHSSPGMSTMVLTPVRVIEVAPRTRRWSVSAGHWKRVSRAPPRRLAANGKVVASTPSRESYCAKLVRVPALAGR